MIVTIIVLCLRANIASSGEFKDDPILSETILIRAQEILKENWRIYKQKYQLSFDKEEDEYRINIYRQNLNYINYFNEEEHSFKLAENHLTHLTHDEYLQWLQERPSHTNFYLGNKHVKDQVGQAVPDKDWNKNGGVSPIKDQGSCSAGYAFAAIAAVESSRYIKLRSYTDLSEQDVIDCSDTSTGTGCQTGSIKTAFQYILDYGVVPEAYYPYEEKSLRCKRPQLTTAPIAKIKGFMQIQSGDEEALSQAVYKTGPVAAAIDASSKTFRFYSCGLYVDDACQKNDPNHAVLVTGIYSGTTPMYIVKNSFGIYWGNKGSMEFARYRGNMCGIASGAAYPV